MNLIKQIIKKFLSKLDLKVIIKSKNQSNFDILINLINKYKIDLVLDVGANEGQFAKELRNLEYHKKIVSFEPLGSVYKVLLKNSSRDPDWEVYERCCIGEFDGFVDMNISSYSPSSSILNFTHLHLNAKPSAVMVKKEKTKMHKLDTAIKNITVENKKILLKLDTQGYEGKILDGAENILKKIDIIICEMSLKEVYEGQELFKDIIERLDKQNFKIASLQNGFYDKKSDHLLQIDAIFIK
jgi:FkbM family methyltransferase